MAHSQNKDPIAFPSRQTAAGDTWSATRPAESSAEAASGPAAGPPPATHAMSLRWHSIEPRARFATVADDTTGLRLHVVVEQLPDSTEWDWFLWRAGHAASLTVGGRARSALVASVAAEAAARAWR